MENPKPAGDGSGSERFDELAERVAECHRVYAKTDVLQRLITAVLQSGKKGVGCEELRRMINDEDKDALGEAVRMGLMVKRKKRFRLHEEMGRLLGEKRVRRGGKCRPKKPKVKQDEKAHPEKTEETPPPDMLG